MRLELTREDLSKPSIPGSERGVRVWWVRRPRRKTPATVVAWPDLALINVKPVWPTGVHPDRHQGWGEEAQSFRVFYAEKLGRSIVSEGCPVWDLAEIFAHDRVSATKLKRTKHTTRVDRSFRFVHLVRADGTALYVSALALKRIDAALGESVQYSEGEFAWSGEKRVVCVYRRGKLRAVVGGLAESDYFAAAKAEEKCGG